jgi:hypothetical protein
MKSILTSIVAFAVALNALEQVPLELKGKPNIVVILTDDQDLHMHSLDYMPLLKKHITDHGTFFKRHYCSTAICCPSRVTLWTGRNAHNTNVTDVFPPYGQYLETLQIEITNQTQAATPNSYPKASMRTISQSGFKPLDIVLITPASYSTPTRSRTGTPLTPQAGQALTSYWIRTHTSTSTQPSNTTPTRPRVTKASIPLTCWHAKPTPSSTRLLRLRNRSS